jgi:hypothetical protein
MIREPEAGWWATQADFGEPAAAGGRTTTVAAVREQDADAEAVVARLAELAVADDLLVVLGSASCVQPGHHAVIAGLRNRLPQHRVVAVPVRNQGSGIHRYAAAIEWFLATGSLPVAVTAPGALHGVAAEISSYVRADRVLRVFRTNSGAGLYQVWRRHPEPSVG